MRPYPFTPANVRALHASRGTSYPHMSVADSEVWRNFLRASTVEFTRLDYDVSLGASGADAEFYDPEDGGQWMALRQKRVDVVAYVGDEVWIVEVKPIANMAALGQVLTYGHLWDETFGAGKESRRVVVGGQIDADVPAVYRRLNVALYRADASGLERVA